MPDSAPCFRPDVLLAQAGWVRKLARALVLDSNRADDVVQKTWLAALEKPGAEVVDVRAWLAGVVRNVIRQERRSESRRASREHDARRPDPLPPVADLVARADLQKHVVQAVLELEEPQRSTLLLHYFEELSAEEIARRLEVPASTVRSRIQAGLATLRARFDRERDGDRRAWSLGLIPLMLPRGNAAAALVSSTSTGMLAMIIKGSLVTTLAVALGLGASYAFKQVLPAALEPVAAQSLEATPAHTREPADPRSSVLGLAEGQQEGQRRPLAPLAQSVTVQGRVLDLAGAPVAGAAVFVGGRPSPFGSIGAGVRLVPGNEKAKERQVVKGEPGEDYREEVLEGVGVREWAAIDLEKLEKHGALLGKLFTTDGAGRFAASVPSGARVYVTFSPRVGLRKTGNGAWHAAPATGIELRVARIPTVALAISVTDQTTGKQLAFAGELYGSAGLLGEWEAEGVVRRTVEVPPDANDRLRLEVVAPLWARTTHEFHVSAGSEIPVEILVQSGAGLPGEVVDARGRAVEGALVYWGELLDLRWGSLFNAYEPGRLVGGVRTDALGRFTLPGTAARVSAWHADHSPTTVAAGEAAHLVLPARGAIRGVVLDEHGRAAVGWEAKLDRSREAATDAQGAFLFENVEAGVHGVSYGRERFVGVVVAPGETAEIPPEEPLEVRGAFTTGGVPYTKPTGGVIFGLARVFSVSEWRNDAGRLQSGRVRAGRHLMMSNAGFLKVLDVQAEAESSIELGTARVTLERVPDDPLVYLLPEEAAAHPAARFWARHFFESRQGPSRVFAPLTAGRYVLVVEGRDADLTVDVADGQELVIPRERWLRSGSER